MKVASLMGPGSVRRTNKQSEEASRQISNLIEMIKDGLEVSNSTSQSEIRRF